MDFAGGGDSSGGAEDAEGWGVIPFHADFAGGVGEDVVGIFFFIDGFAEEGFDGHAVFGFEVGVAGVGDAGAGEDFSGSEKGLELKIGDVGGFAGFAASATIDDKAGAGDGFEAAGVAAGWLCFGKDGSVLTALGDVGRNVDAIFYGLLAF